MSATERICALLDERGVEYEAPHAGFTIVRTDNAVCKFYETLEEPERGVFAVVTTDWLTPEQAIAATLGSCNVGRYVGLRQGEYWERTENSNYYCGGCGWKVTDHDSYCPECGGALHEYALGTETCHITDNGPWGYPYVCSECGASFDPDVNNGESNYCPNCGRRIEQ